MPKENISFEHFDPDLELGKILDANGKPIKLRKKPGRKPNPPSPAQRKAQNRAAQRAFRERKRREMREAELTVQECMKERSQTIEELNRCKKRIEELEFENKYLKGYALTLKLTCSAHQIQVPRLWENGAEEMSFSETKDIPQELEFFLDRNTDIMPLDISEEEQLPPSSILESPLSSSLSSSSSSDIFSDIHSDFLNNTTTTADNEDYVLDDALSTIAPQLASHLETSFFQQLLKTDLVVNHRHQPTTCVTKAQENSRCISDPIDHPRNNSVSSQMTSLDAIEQVRLVKNLDEEMRTLFTSSKYSLRIQAYLY